MEKLPGAGAGLPHQETRQEPGRECGQEEDMALGKLKKNAFLPHGSRSDYAKM
jgi:hypothetical protein